MINQTEEIRPKLQEVAEAWKGMPQGSLTEREDANNYYREVVFPQVKKIFLSTQKQKVTQEYAGLILSVGTSPEPLILSISVLSPQKVLFLCTEQSEKYLDYIISETSLSYRQVEKRLVDETNPLQIYTEIKQAWERWGKVKSIAVDITGGTKSMVGGSAMAGSIIGAQLVYIANGKYLTSFRRPEPGTESLEFIPNPYTVFGDIEAQHGYNLYNRHDYSGATQVFMGLKDRVPDPQKFEVLAFLSNAYDLWDNLDLKRSVKLLEKVVKLVDRYSQGKKNFFLSEQRAILNYQSENLGHLSEKMPQNHRSTPMELLLDLEAFSTLAFTIYHSALRKEEVKRFDVASLLLYRLLEMLEQRRLAVLGINSATPNYQALSTEPATLLDKMNAIRNYPLDSLPTKIALRNGYELLEALNDELQLKKAGVSWQDFDSLTESRNLSILAHGYIFVSFDLYNGFRKMIDKLFQLFCKVEGIDYQAYLEKYRFIEFE